MVPDLRRRTRALALAVKADYRGISYGYMTATLTLSRIQVQEWPMGAIPSLTERRVSSVSSQGATPNSE